MVGPVPTDARALKDVADGGRLPVTTRGGFDTPFLQVRDDAPLRLAVDEAPGHLTQDGRFRFADGHPVLLEAIRPGAAAVLAFPCLPPFLAFLPLAKTPGFSLCLDGRVDGIVPAFGGGEVKATVAVGCLDPLEIGGL